MSKLQRNLTVFALLALFSTPILADDGFTFSWWQEVWGDLVALFSADEIESGGVYIPSGGDQPQSGGVYIPSGDQIESGGVYIPSG